MNNSTVKENITRIRKDNGLSQSDMAEKLGISRTAYRNIEKGDTKLISDSLDKIADIFSLSPEEIVLGYAPSQENSRKLREMQQAYSNRHSETIDRYEEEIRKLHKEINTLNNLIDALKDSIKTKDEMIAMLRKLAGERQIQ